MHPDHCANTSYAYDKRGDPVNCKNLTKTFQPWSHLQTGLHLVYILINATLHNRIATEMSFSGRCNKIQSDYCCLLLDEAVILVEAVGRDQYYLLRSIKYNIGRLNIHICYILHQNYFIFNIRIRRKEVKRLSVALNCK